MPPAVVLDSVFESRGVSDGSRIVLYWSKDWYSPTTRVFLTLDYLGLGERTSILDGGLAARKAVGGPVTTEVPTPTRGRLTRRPRSDVIVDAAAVRSALDDARVAVIDARDPRFYAGQTTGMHVREGMSPGRGISRSTRSSTRRAGSSRVRHWRRCWTRQERRPASALSAIATLGSRLRSYTSRQDFSAATSASTTAHGMNGVACRSCPSRPDGADATGSGHVQSRFPCGTTRHP